jgi:hypothetical protein
MTIQIDSLPKDDRTGDGPYVLLADYGTDGLCVVARGYKVEDVYSRQGEAYGSPVTLLKVVDIVVEELAPVKVREAEYYE